MRELKLLSFPARKGVARRSRISARTLLCAATLGVALAAGPLTIAPALAGQATMLRVSPNEYGATQHIALDLNKSILIDLPADVKEMVVSQPGIAGAIMRSKRRAFIQGTGAGETNVFFLDAQGNRIAVIDISVVHDASTLEASLAQLLPGSRIRVKSFGERVVLSGHASSADDVAKAFQVATQFTGDPAAVANLINAAGGQQIMLKVTIAEVARETMKELGISLSASISGGGLTTSVIGPNAPNVTGGGYFGISAGNFSLGATLKALDQRGALRTLAEPTLTAMSGQEAEFLAGGEFPVPVSFEDNKVTYEFKEFGVKLKFTPTVKSGGLVGLAVDTSVSELSNEGAINVGGVVISATKERQAKTSVELPSGSTLAIGGLIEDRLRQQISKLPGLGDIPVLGALFRSREFTRAQTELIILVTPYIAEATTGNVPLPTDYYEPADDAEAIFLGHMEKLYSVGEPQGGLRGGYQGSVGFVID